MANAFSKPMNIRPNLMKVIHGRKGQATEYVEYRPFRVNIRWAAQKVGDRFVVFRFEVNSRGRIESSQTMQSWDDADAAAHQAHDAAMNEAEG